jgi:uncharacterized membrane protein
VDHNQRQPGAFDPYPFGLLTLIVSLEALANHLGLDVSQVYATAHARIEQARAQQNEAAPASPAAGPQSPGTRPGA